MSPSSTEAENPFTLHERQPRTAAVEDFLDTVKTGEWIFRAQLSRWELRSTLERACVAWGIESEKRPDAEEKLLREFKRHPLPRGLVDREEDDLEWMAAMRHYGAPSRLLDWTYSPYVALYFAFAEYYTHNEDRDKNKEAPSADEKDTRVAIWALKTKQVADTVEETLSSKGKILLKEFRNKREPAHFRKLFMNGLNSRKGETTSFRELFWNLQVQDFVLSVTPMKLNPRLRIQHGALLCPSNVEQGIQAILKSMNLPQGSWHKFVFPHLDSQPEKAEVFELLHKMNLTARNLFPDLYGYCEDMKHRLKFLADLRTE